VLYHHGCPQRRNLMTREGLSWLAAQPLPAGAREQISVALSVIDALDRQLAPLDKELRSYARRQAGCKTLMGQFGVGELTAVTIRAELGDARRFSSSRDAVRYAWLDITVHQSDQRRAAGHLSRQVSCGSRSHRCARRPRPFVSKLFPKWHCKRLLRTDPLKALIIGGFVRGLSIRDVESLCEEAGLGKTSRSTVSRVCSEDQRGLARARPRPHQPRAPGATVDRR
jgi:transposase